jgi:hypothetical protein
MTALDFARLSAWLVVAVYLMALVQERWRTCEPLRRITWTAGAIALLGHTVWTFFAIHHGSLDEALAHTAFKTEQLLGLRFGAGLYANFAMLVIWLADAAAWWLAPNWNQIRSKYIIPLHVAFSFMFLNAAIVFASPWGRLFGVMANALAILVAILGATLGKRSLDKRPLVAREKASEGKVLDS